jgi:hypothetical protein
MILFDGLHEKVIMLKIRISQMKSAGKTITKEEKRQGVKILRKKRLDGFTKWSWHPENVVVVTRS